MILISNADRNKSLTIEGQYIISETFEITSKVDFDIDGGGGTYNVTLIDGDSANLNTLVDNLSGTSFDITLGDFKNSFASGETLITSTITVEIEDVVNIAVETKTIDVIFTINNLGSLLETLPLVVENENLNRAIGFEQGGTIENIEVTGYVNLNIRGGSGEFDIIWDAADFIHPALTLVNADGLTKAKVDLKLGSNTSDIPEEYLGVSGGEWVQSGELDYTVRDKLTLEEFSGKAYWSFKIFVHEVRDIRSEYRYESRTVSSRFRIRDEDGISWYDMCYDEMYVYNTHEREWMRLIPGKTYVRDANNIDWLEVNCDFDPEFDDPCKAIGDDNCNGAVSDPFAGSGNGSGSNGAEFDVEKGYPFGYDLPDSFLGGFAVSTLPISANASVQATGFLLQRPGLLSQETFDPTGLTPSDDDHTGSWRKPNEVGASTFGRGSAVTETIYELTDSDGFYEVLYAAYSTISIDVYYLGKRVATTCGQVPKQSRGVLSFPIKIAINGGHKKVLVRVRGDNFCDWAIQLVGPKVADNFIGFDPQSNLDYAEIEGNTQPDFIRPEYLGTPIFPAPCRATVGNTNVDRAYPWYLSDRVLSSDFFEYYHYCGDVDGNMVLDYSSWNNSDKIEIFHAGVRIATNYDFKNANGSIIFKWRPSDSDIHEIVVRVYTETGDMGEQLSSWYYSLYCVGISPVNGKVLESPIGQRAYPWDCDAGADGLPTQNHVKLNEVFSMGHPCMEDHINIDNDVDKGVFRIQFSSGELSESESIVTVFNKVDNSIIPCYNAITKSFEDSRLVNGQSVDLDYFNFNQVSLEVFRDIYVRVESIIGESWKYKVGCPIPLIDITLDPIEPSAKISIDDGAVVAGDGAGQVMIRLDRKMPVDITVDYTMEDGSALDQVDYCKETKSITFPAGVTEMPVVFALAPCGEVVPDPDPEPVPTDGGWETGFIAKVDRHESYWQWDGYIYEIAYLYVGKINLTDDVSQLTSVEPPFIGARTMYVGEGYINGKPATLNDPVSMRTITVDTTDGPVAKYTSPNFGDIHWEIPKQTNIEAWRVTQISGTDLGHGNENLGIWYTNVVHTFGIFEKVSDSIHRTREAVIKIEYRYNDGTIISHLTTLITTI